jgi:glycosyltransferase involved in cell wall biosynthesis
VDNIKVIRYSERVHLLEAPIVPQIGLRLLLEECDIIHIHGVTPSISDLAIVNGKLKGKPLVLTYHNDPDTRLFGIIGVVAAQVYGHLSYILANLTDCIVATTASYAETSPVLSRLLHKVKIVPWAVDKEKFKSSIRRNLGEYSRNHDNCVLFVGQLKEHKGVQYLLDAMKIINAKTEARAHLIIIGDGPYRDFLMNYASKLKLSDVVSFKGNVPDKDLPQFYAASDVVVLPSYTRREAFGLVLLEAMASAKPVIASNIPGVRDLVKDDWGILLPPKDPKELASAITELLLDKPRARKMGFRARENVEENFDWATVIDRYETLYENIC